MTSLTMRRDAKIADCPRCLRPDSHGNARELHDSGPPVTEEEIRAELGTEFQILDLHEFRFDEARGVPVRFLGWSCLVENR
jgi:hypothetical protein